MLNDYQMKGILMYFIFAVLPTFEAG